MTLNAKCSRCGRDMMFQFRIGASTPGHHYVYFSCLCGRVTSETRNQNDEQESEILLAS